MDLEQRTAALLALIEQYRARRCAELLEPARDEARQTVRAALADARRRVHTAIVEERTRYATEVGAVEAALATERRLAQQRHAVTLLATAWGELRTRLLAHWQAAPTRAEWVRAYLERALRAVPCAGGGWRIDTHAAWSDGERARWIERLRSEGIAPLTIEPSATIAAGFRVVSGNNVLDATIDGLLADRTQLEGRLLHHLQEERR
jgi:hypothetical protein